MRIVMTSSHYGAMNFTAYRSAFGRHSFKNIRHGSYELITTDPIDACYRLKKQPTKHHKGYAAFIERGTCAFEEKIMNAKKNGAGLALIYDNTYEGPIMMGQIKAVC